MPPRLTRLLISASFCLLFAPAGAQTTAGNPDFKPELAARLGADQIGMRHYVMVILKTGPTPVAAGKERDAMFAGHFANIKRLADEGKLVVAGPADGVNGWRGVFLFAVATIDEAKQLAATDPVLQQGEMVAEYHKMYMSAGLMNIPELHKQISEKSF